MPELQFIGKEFVYNHHLTVPYRPLIVDAAKGIGDGSLDDNLIIHGDNLHALKALLPRYAGKVDCIFIDPPYNTGNENWAYNDNVNSPLMNEWLSSNPVNGEDMLRHDKWCCMMWPRLRLLWELLTETGVLFVSIDDNEAQNLLILLDDIFGSENHVATFVWRKVDSPNDNKVAITPDHEFVISFAKNKDGSRFLPMVEPSILDAYSNKDENGRLYRDRLLKKNGRNSLRTDRPTMYFGIEDPDGNHVYPVHDNGQEARWAAGPAGVERHREAGTLIWKRRFRLGQEVWEPYTREFAPEVPTRPYPTIWYDIATMRQAKAMLRDIFPVGELFATPKPVELISRILDIALPASNRSATILDSFAGSGTTAHAVLKANERDNGNRRFILVETEGYADNLTAERVRRVINGYPYTGTQREALLEKKLNWSNLQKAEALVQEAKNTAALYEGSYDKVETKVEDGTLKVIGIRNVKETAPGVGGTFTYCTLGEPIDLDKILTGESLPSFENMASWLVNTAYGETVPESVDHRGEGMAEWYVGELDSAHVWLIYRPDKAFLQSRESTLTLELAEAMAQAKPSKPHLVFAPAKYVGKKALDALVPKVEFAPLPFALYRMERG